MEEQNEKKPKKQRSPFKDKDELRKDIVGFINKHKASIAIQANRISDFFEMSCFNYLVRYYQLDGFTVKIQNLQNGQYRYKCSTMGVQTNFSYFSITKEIDGVVHAFEIHHNLAVQSAHHEKIFTTPDITVIRANGLDSSKEHYETKITFSFVKQIDLITFCEVKQFNPYPELLFNFMGVVNELIPNILTNTASSHLPAQIAPTLMVSGIPNRHTNEIKESLQTRYAINILYNLFYGGASVFSKARFRELQTTGKVKDRALHGKKVIKKNVDWIEKIFEFDEEPPF